MVATPKRPPRSRRVYRRRRPLPESIRRCGRSGAARARRALEQPDARPPETEQLELNLSDDRTETPFDEASPRRDTT